MSIKCPNCNIAIDKKNMIKMKNKGAIFFLKKSSEKDVEDIIKYHIFPGVYIICHKCQTLITT